MKAFAAIYKKEMTSYFQSPIAYVLLVGFLALTGYFFYSGTAFYSMASLQAMQNPMMGQLNIQDMLIRPLLANMSIILMLMAPLLTMRLLSEEKRTGTLELLLSYPLSDTVVVLGKFLAAWSFLILMGLATWAPMALLFWLSAPELVATLTGYLGLFLMGGAFISLGIWASAMTENQIVAAVAGFAGILLMWVLGWTSEIAGPQAGPFLKAVSLGTHFDNFPKGIIDTADLAYYALFMGFFLFLTIRALEAKRWKA